MSNLFHNQWKNYYQLPCLPDDLEASLSLAAFRYYGFLCRCANKHSAPVLEFSNEEIGCSTGIRDHKTLNKARTGLVHAGLIVVERVPPGIYRHTLLNGAGEPIPAPTDRKGIRRYNPRPAESNKNSNKAPTIDVFISQPVIPLPTNTIFCRTHGVTEHWSRDGDQVCQKCHPDPRRSAPTAQEVGF